MNNKIKSALWVIGGLVASKILNEILYPLFNSPSTGISPIRAFIPAAISTCLIGFCVYRAYQAYKTNNEVANEDDLNTNKSQITFLQKNNLSILLIGILTGLLVLTNLEPIKKFISKEKIYDVYSCSVPATYRQDECGELQLKMTAKFLVDKDRQQVLVEYTMLDAVTKRLVELKKCVVIDSENWKCGDVLKSEDYGLSYDGMQQMINGEVTTTDSFIGASRSGKGTLYVKANKFKLK